MTTVHQRLNNVLGSLHQHLLRYRPDPILNYFAFLKRSTCFCPQILIAGTNGKGSVASYLATVYRESGYRSGLFLTPHLLHPRERMLIDGQPISKSEMLRTYLELKPDVDAFTAATGETLTFFEWMLIIALNWFERSGCQVIVVEAGLGGLRDATRCLNPELAVLTNVRRDHLHILGPELADVTHEKAGIFLNARVGLCRKSEPHLDKILATANSSGCQMEYVESQVKVQSLAGLGMQVDLQCYLGSVVTKSGLLGLHQAENLEIVLDSLRILAPILPISPESLASGVANTRHQGRLEVLCNEPLILVDGCHNADGLLSLKRSIKAMYPDHRITWCLAMKKRKAENSLAEILSGERVFAVAHREKGFMDQAELLHNFPNAKIFRGRNQALMQFMTDYKDKDLLLFCGSLRFAGLVRKQVQKKSYKIKQKKTQEK